MPFRHHLALLVRRQYVSIILLRIFSLVPSRPFPVFFVIGNWHKVPLNIARETRSH